jgi:hypothetical protein
MASATGIDHSWLLRCGFFLLEKGESKFYHKRAKAGFEFALMAENGAYKLVGGGKRLSIGMTTIDEIIMLWEILTGENLIDLIREHQKKINKDDNDDNATQSK